MPEIGETKQGFGIGIKSSNKFIWHACIDCGKERWVHFERISLRCHKCEALNRRGGKNPNWFGGQTITREGYVFIRNPIHPRAKPNGYVKRAIFVLEEKLGRPLLPDEVTHHINGIKDDDRPENLMALPFAEHSRLEAKKMWAQTEALQV